ncbi:hypothetical protein [Sediminispirochaeta bajacaliforniensis]|uniref:hypothetical protein n=1 Tax=Sediminispirochaeta bajacaliforniensis TaxID=148 RepID=UPI000374333F|nr:hypothetical protein [Sediminispirochaeta bajacaliforniensis]
MMVTRCWRKGLALLLLFIPILELSADDVLRIPSVIRADTSASAPDASALWGRMTQALSRSGLQKPGNGMLLISGSAASSLLSPSQGAVVAPKWIAVLPSEAPSSFFYTFFPLLVQKFGVALESAPLRDLIPDDTVIQFEFPQSMNDSSMPLRDLSFLALDPLAAAFSGMQTGSGSCRLPLRLVFHGEEKIVMARLRLFSLQDHAYSSAVRSGDQLRVSYGTGGVLVKFSARVESVDERTGTLRIRPLSSLFRDERGTPRFDAVLDENGKATIVDGALK